MGRILFFILLFYANFSFGQNDSIPLPDAETSPEITKQVVAQDSVGKKKRNNFITRYFREGYPNPKKAAILSLILPGTGQIYNKKGLWYKLPIVYGGTIAGIYFIDSNTKQYKFLRDQYKYLVDDDISTVSIFEEAVEEGILSASTIKNERIKFNKWRQMTYAGFMVGYLLIASEAYVTAHLLSFDVSDDLSLQINPNFELTPNNQLVTGVGLKLKLRVDKKDIPKFKFSSP